jgi:hypothetical protein
MLRSLRLPLVAAAVFAAAGPAAAQPAGKNVTLPFPAKAPLVIAVAGWQKTTDRLAKMTAALPKAEAQKVRDGLELGIDKIFEGRKSDAVPGDRRIYAVVHDITKLGDDEPAFALLFPTTGYAEFKDTFLTAAERRTLGKAGRGVETVEASFKGEAKKFYLADLKDHVVVSPSEEVAAGYVGQYTRALSGQMGDLGPSFLAADAAVYVNMDVINDLYGDQIRQVKGLIDFGLQQAEQGGNLPGLDRKQIEMVKTLLTGFVQGVEDSTGILLAAEFRPEGLNLKVQAKFATETPTATALAGEAPTPLAGIGRMPKGLTIYGGSRFGKKIGDSFRGFAQQFAAPDGQDAAEARIVKQLEALGAAGAGAEYTGGTGPDAMLTVTEYKNAKKAAAALVGVYQAVPEGGKVQGVIVKDRPRVTDAAVEHKGFTFAEVKLSFDFAATVEALPEPAREATMANMKRLVKERMTLWVGTDGKVVATIAAADWRTAAQMLDEYTDGKAGIGADAGFKLARANLPADATAVYLAETGTTLAAMAEQAKAAMAAAPGGGRGGPRIGALRPVDGDPTYLGFALTMKPQAVGIDIFLPGTAMNVAARMLNDAFRKIE